jgi:uncharacterized spore protein YtfJ
VSTPAPPRIGSLRKALAELKGARLCYGEPVEAGGRTVIPVASVSATGGMGWGGGGQGNDQGEGGGGGGHLEAHPLGFIEVGPEGTRFVAVRDPERLARTLRTSLTAVGALATTVVGLRTALREGRALPSPRRLLGRGR